MNVKSMLSAPLTTEQKAQLLQQIMMHCLELQFQFNCTAAAGIQNYWHLLICPKYGVKHSILWNINHCVYLHCYDGLCSLFLDAVHAQRIQHVTLPRPVQRHTQWTNCICLDFTLMGLCLMSKIMLSGRYIWSLTQVSAQHIWPRWLQFANCIDYKTQCWPAGTQTTDQQFNTTLFGAERTLFIHQVQHTLKYSCYVYI